MSLGEWERTTSLAEGRRAFEVYKADKNGYGSNISGNGGDNELGPIPPKLSSQFVAIVDTQTRLGDRMPATLTDVFELVLGQSQSATSHLV